MQKETIEEFLARGGKVTVVPPKEREEQNHVLSPNGNGIPNLLTLEEGDLFFGEVKVRKPKEEVKPKIDFNALPEALRKKYMKELNDDEE